MKISQREASRLRRRVEELERRELHRRRAWSQDFFGGVEISRISYTESSDALPLALRVARKLSHAVVAVGDDSGTVRFIALPLADVPKP